MQSGVLIRIRIVITFKTVTHSLNAPMMGTAVIEREIPELGLLVREEVGNSICGGRQEGGVV